MTETPRFCLDQADQGHYLMRHAGMTYPIGTDKSKAKDLINRLNAHLGAVSWERQGNQLWFQWGTSGEWVCEVPHVFGRSLDYATLAPMVQQALMWLGYWRDKMPDEAVSQLQDILGV